MKKHYPYLFLAILLIWTAGCSAPKNIVYFQNAEYIRGMALQAEQQLTLRPEDKINIVVNSADPMLMQQFNLYANSSNGRSLGSTVTPLTSSGNVSSSSSGVMLAYTVNGEGDINFPVLGKLAVGGKTRSEVAAYVRQRLIERGLVKDPIVTVEYVNLSVKVLGEVKTPGRIDILRDSYTILDAIADAGDLTIDGQRENIMVMREVDGEDQTYFINLCDRQDLLTSSAYYLQQNDVVYVSPTSKRLREARTTGNTFNQPSVWISLASLLTTITALLIR